MPRPWRCTTITITTTITTTIILFAFPFEVLEMQGAICWPSHSEGSFSFVDNVLRSNWKTIWGCRA